MASPESHGTGGWLARALLAADYNLREVERQVEAFLTALFPAGWRGWVFDRSGAGGAISVYEAIESPAAVAALHRAGFAAVTIHMHEASRLITCICTTHEASP